ncbi:MAG TPA: hypothetical protein VEX66_17105 [Microlunatus sp.]|nr:hypothetical protein [Microlunatus sp.]
MTRWTRLAATAGLSVAMALGIVATSADTASAACVHYYWVDQVPAPVRENPSSHSVVRKYKQVFDTVTGPCSPSVRDPHSTRLYVPVYTRAASDGIGWMASQTIQRY